MNKNNEIDFILNSYRDKVTDKADGSSLVCKDQEMISWCMDQGVGDALGKLSHIPSELKKQGRRTLLQGNCKISSFTQFNPDYLEMLEDFERNPAAEGVSTYVSNTVEGHSIGRGGNLIQKIQRAYGIPEAKVPKPTLLLKEPIATKKKIGIHLSIGWSHAGMRFAHPRPRIIYEENLPMIQEFIDENSEYEFVEFGGSSIKLNNVTNLTGMSLEGSVEKIAECEFFIGLNSGFYHIAVGLGVKTIMIVNLPAVELMVLPHLVDRTEHNDLTWLYPQCVHLHQDGGNPLVPKLSKDSLKAAMNGEVFPYWDNKYVEELHEL